MTLSPQITVADAARKIGWSSRRLRRYLLAREPHEPNLLTRYGNTWLVNTAALSRVLEVPQIDLAAAIEDHERRLSLIENKVMR